MRVDIFAQINQERDRQDENWGGANHDCDHSIAEWGRFIARYIKKAISATGRAELGPDEAKERRAARYRLLQVAALAVAALEAHDTNYPRAKPGRNEPFRPKDLHE